MQLTLFSKLIRTHWWLQLTMGIEIVKWQVSFLLKTLSPNNLAIVIFNNACTLKLYAIVFLVVLLIIAATALVIDDSALVTCLFMCSITFPESIIKWKSKFTCQLSNEGAMCEFNREYFLFVANSKAQSNLKIHLSHCPRKYFELSLWVCPCYF